MSFLLVALGAVVTVCAVIGQITGSIQSNAVALMWSAFGVTLTATGLVLQRRER